ncbi:hypothetical protein PVAND_000138 [Polypedilum vanderplanki]|uniref:C2 domain-containing protein n=1 Tax=Polypedilum vanderplanki TaxID=319348 RepID=A0A9J6BJT7_POLVA|nr:hypothetical protein PVAND_000138 [Polypedilum vanderplanki]
MDIATENKQETSDNSNLQTETKEQEEISTGDLEIDIKMLPKQKKLNLFNEIQNSCVQQNIGEERKLKIASYMRETLSLSANEINENVQLKALTMLEDFFTYHDLIVAFAQHEMKQKIWEKDLSNFAYEILEIFAKSKGITDSYILYARWAAFVEIYDSEKIDLNIFTDILDRIFDDNNEEEKEVKTCMPIFRKMVTNDYTTDDEINKIFWQSTTKLFQKFAGFFAEYFMNMGDDEDENIMVKLNEMIDLILRVENLAKEQNYDITFESKLKEEVANLVTNQLQRFVNKDILSAIDDDGELCLNVLIEAVKFITSHFQEVYKQNFEIFQRLQEYSFAKNLYIIYDEKITETIKPMIEETTKSFKQESQAITVIAAIQLYEELKKFSQIGTENYHNCDLQLASYENWFPSQLIKIIKTPELISKAIASENDDSSNDFANYKRTSSAVDSMALIFTVKDFWAQFENKGKREDEALQFIVNELCRLTLDYIDKYMNKFDNDESESDTYNNRLIKMSIAVANFQFVLEELQGLLKNNLQEFNFIESDNVREIFKNTFKIIEDKMTTTIEVQTEKFMPEFQKWVMEAAADENNRDKFLDDFYNLLTNLEKNLKQKRFETAKKILWNQIIKILPQILDDAINDNESQEFFSNLKEIWLNLKEMNLPINDEEKDIVANFEESLEWYSMESSELLYRQYEHQSKKISNTASATVICSIVNNKLKIEILNARNLNALVPDSNCHSFIKFKPIHKEFNSVSSQQTKVHENSHFPLFEESFEIELTEKQRKCQNAAIYFKLKRKLPLGTVSTLGEAFLSFREIPIITDENQKPLRKELSFIKLSEDECDGVKTMTVLKYRKKSNDETTKKILIDMKYRDKAPTVDFVKKQMVNVIRTSYRKSSKLIPKLNM